jgi:hypothetical protein
MLPALYGIFPEQLAMNLPPNWLPYVASNDVFYLTKLVKENNGKVITNHAILWMKVLLQ